MTITLTPELERAVVERAKNQGTSPEVVALDALRNALVLPVAAVAKTPPPSPGEGTLADALKEFIGCIHSGEYVPGGAQMSTDTGKKFGEIVWEKYKKGQL